MKIIRAMTLIGFALVGGCDLIDKLPPVQLCVTYKGKQFCASKVNGVWRFEAELTADEQDEIVRHIEGQ